MPGKRTPADPGEMNKSTLDISPHQAGAQVPPTDREQGGQFEQGEAPPEGAYREVPTTGKR
ncbi:MAG TPA: hypothetical protein VD973_19805 [Symbiobacteriaceae bacterium]|jgi:hypothetical protein|nr:hypothetical protein [Symbiobacteriaceae bacterium]